jgi:hypothetical protein
MARTVDRGSDGKDVPEFVDGVREARDEVRRERRILRAEADAFEAFRSRVRDVDADAESVDSTGGASTASGALAARTDRASRSGSESVREAYVATVMDTAHYSAEYGDNYWESVATEFGDEIATALRQSAAVTPLLKERLLAAARNAESNRWRTLSAFEWEESALEDAAVVLGSVREELVAIRSRPFYGCSDDELRQLRADLRPLEERCQDVAVRRQAGDLEPPSLRPSSASGSLNEYLYGSLPSTHPVLNAVGRASDLVAGTSRRIDRVLEAASAE